MEFLHEISCLVKIWKSVSAYRRHRNVCYTRHVHILWATGAQMCDFPVRDSSFRGLDRRRLHWVLPGKLNSRIRCHKAWASLEMEPYWRLVFGNERWIRDWWIEKESVSWRFTAKRHTWFVKAQIVTIAVSYQFLPHIKQKSLVRHKQLLDKSRNRWKHLYTGQRLLQWDVLLKCPTRIAAISQNQYPREKNRRYSLFAVRLIL